MKLAIIGATGLVGQQMLQTINNRNFMFDELLLVASAKSKGKKILFKGKEHTIIEIDEAINARPDIAIFSAGGDTSLEWAPKFERVGTFVIDNSSAWRMSPAHKLIVPEINADELQLTDKIIANPNCSTIQMVMALAPLQKAYGINRLVISTYQSVTGTGKAAVDQMMNERNNIEGDKVYPYQIDMNVLPHIDVFLENDYTKEEMKMVNETRKIFSDNDIKITATAVRLPVMGGHSESVNVELKKDFTIEDVRNLIGSMPGVVLQDDVRNNIYPMPINAHNRDEVFVGRIRRDDSNENTLNMWIVADNLRKGAATNAVQIAEYLVEKNFV